MRDAWRSTVEALIGSHTGSPARCAGVEAVPGGCIHDARLVHLADGRSFFVKSRADTSRPDLFEREAEGLRALGGSGLARVPEVLGTAPGPPSILVLEAITVGSPGSSFQAEAGRRLAELHRATATHRCGFDHDNYLGETLQPNAWTDHWVDFWRHHRLGHQLTLARRAGLSDPALDRQADRLMDRLEDYLGPIDEPQSLLHGDLWGGNLLADEHGSPVFIDPATYYGHREADLAMTGLFGGFEPAFYHAYEAVWPLADGAEQRRPLYELYHLLNHLNLFGGGYRSSCLQRLRQLV